MLKKKKKEETGVENSKEKYSSLSSQLAKCIVQDENLSLKKREGGQW